MHENIIETLIRLFAIITDNRDKNQEKGSKLIETYLNSVLTVDLVEKYMHLYEVSVKYYHNHRKNEIYTTDKNGNKNIDSAYISEICRGISTHNDLQVRFSVVNQLLNFAIHGTNGDLEDKLKTIQVVANEMNIDTEEYEEISKFATDNISNINRKEWLFVIDGNEAFADKNIKHLQRENQTVKIIFIHIPSINTLFFRYIGPRNLYLNGHRLANDLLYPFPQGGILKTSRITPIYYSTVMSRFIQHADSAKTVFNVDKVKYNFNKTTTGLHEISFQEQSGDLIGIIGGSGVGKTTLLSVLSGKLKPTEGEITINGYDINDPNNEDILTGAIGYVPQDDLLIEELTVFDNLLLNAKFCFGNMHEEQMNIIVDQTLKDFDLVEARNLVVGNPLKKVLSGGQRKRLNIALELMREPSILFADEPTSGLSSADSEKVMYLLKRQCLKGRLVFANIHQPSSDIYKLFDRIIIMDKGGRIVFFGNPRDSVTYFKNEAGYVNPNESECLSCGNLKTEQPLRIIESRMVDPMGKIIRKRKVSPEEWHKRYKEKVEPVARNFMEANPVSKLPLPETPYKKPSWFEQFKLFFKRDFASKKANKQYLVIALFEAPILACILGFFTRYTDGTEYLLSKNDNLPSFIFMSVIVALFVGLTVSAEEIFKDRKIRMREEFLNLSKGAYLSAKIIMLFSLSAIQLLSFAVIGNIFIGVLDLTFGTWLILFSAACFANMLGLNLSSGLDSAVTIYITVPLLLVPQLLLSGVIVDFNKMPRSISTPEYTPVIGDIMVSRWAYEALSVYHYSNNQYEKHFFDTEIEKNKWSFSAFYYIPEVRRTLKAHERMVNDGVSSQATILCPIISNSLVDLSKHFELPHKLRKQLKYMSDGIDSEFPYLQAYSYLDSLQNIFKKNYDAENLKIDKIYNLLLKNFDGDKLELQAFKDKCTNDKLALFVRDSYSSKKIYMSNNRIHQADEPIYKLPLECNGRAHFYAPYKYIGNIKIPTFWFNVLFIWFLTSIMAILLYFDLLRKLIVYVRSWRLTRQEKRIERLIENAIANVTRDKKEM